MRCVPPARRTAAFTLVELLVCVLIIGIMATMILTGISGLTRRSALATCAGNMREIGAGILMYVAENNGQFPIGKDSSDPENEKYWYKEVSPYLSQKAAAAKFDTTAKVFVCPTAAKEDRRFGNYIANRTLLISVDKGAGDTEPTRLNSIARPSQTVMLLEGYNATSIAPIDTWGAFVGTSWNGPGRLPHGKSPPKLSRDATIGDTMNVLYADGHVQTHILTNKPAMSDYLARPESKNSVLGPGITLRP